MAKQKTVTFAITHFAVAFSVTTALTGDFIIGGIVALIEPAVNTVAYYFHEKVWQKRMAARKDIYAT
ncbi:DUF2061 domain-containing protein [Catenovulum sp. SM1970]|uniref:DUF2061 domain-containing protein n=1 Tax=Marinifaba aquimaris TaxID=2741323 RepID=UPI001571F6E7|nr:DUF2061 domain-containing protein [Marinifaba aquimaris]NTS76218.1 DUF2061 domain-containing protein [Marinifaba aquimaris]